MTYYYINHALYGTIKHSPSGFISNTYLVGMIHNMHASRPTMQCMHINLMSQDYPPGALEYDLTLGAHAARVTVVVICVCVCVC